MARPTYMLDVYSEKTGLRRPTLGVLDIHLRDANLRTKGGRGRSAAHVTARDIAHLIAASLAARELQLGPDAVERLSVTRLQGRRSAKVRYKAAKIPELAKLPDAHSFVDAIEALLIAFTTGSLAEARRRRGTRAGAHALPMIEIGATIPATIGDLRISGTGDEVTDVRFVLPPEPESESGAVTKAAQRKYAEWLARDRLDEDFSTYNRITERSLAALADALSQTEEKKQ